MTNEYFTLKSKTTLETFRFSATLDNAHPEKKMLMRSNSMSILGTPISVTVGSYLRVTDIIVSFSGDEDGIIWGTYDQLVTLIEEGVAEFQHWNDSISPYDVVFIGDTVDAEFLSADGSVKNVRINFVEQGNV